jgi:hypothetical protein
MRRVLHYLPDGSGYHCALEMACGHGMVTRSVNEGATVHAQSLIRTANYPDLFANASRYHGLPDGSGYHCIRATFTLRFSDGFEVAFGHVMVTRSVNEVAAG